MLFSYATCKDDGRKHYFDNISDETPEIDAPLEDQGEGEDKEIDQDKDQDEDIDKDQDKNDDEKLFTGREDLQPASRSRSIPSVWLDTM